MYQIRLDTLTGARGCKIPTPFHHSAQDAGPQRLPVLKVQSQPGPTGGYLSPNATMLAGFGEA